MCKDKCDWIRTEYKEQDALNNMNKNKININHEI